MTAYQTTRTVVQSCTVVQFRAESNSDRTFLVGDDVIHRAFQNDRHLAAHPVNRFRRVTFTSQHRKGSMSQVPNEAGSWNCQADKGLVQSDD